MIEVFFSIITRPSYSRGSYRRTDRCELPTVTDLFPARRGQCGAGRTDLPVRA